MLSDKYFKAKQILLNGHKNSYNFMSLENRFDPLIFTLTIIVCRNVFLKNYIKKTIFSK